MQCPQCAYESQAKTMQCPRCHGTFPRAALEELGHLQYTRKRVDGWWDDGTLPARLAQRLLAVMAAEEEELLKRMNPHPEAVAAVATLEAAPSISRGRVHEEAAAIAAKAASQPRTPAAVVARTMPPPRTTAVLPPAIGGVPRGPAQPGDTVPLALRPSPARRLSPAMSAPPPPPKPALPPRPAFTWKKVGTYLLSERTLNALLGLGAFLILAAAVVISTFNPTGLGPLPHLAAMIGTTLVFYAAAAAVQQKLKLMRTGAALFAIGAAFIPLDVATLGWDVLKLEPGSIWVLASVICLPLYLASHLWLRDRAFALLTAAAGASLVMSLVQPLGVAPIWGGCALVGLSCAYLIVAHRLSDDWKHLRLALFWTAQMATPVAMAALFALRFVPKALEGFPPNSFLDTLGALPGASLDYALGATWWLGAAFYALSAHLFPRRAYALATAWTIPCAYLFTLTKAPFGAEWYGLCLAALAAVYVAFGRRIQGLPAGVARPSLAQLLEQPAYQVGLTLSVVASLWPAALSEGRFSSVSEALTLWLLVGLYAGSALAFRHILFRYAAAYLIPVALASTLSLHNSWTHDLVPFGLTVLAASYLLFGRFALRPAPSDDSQAAYLALGREPVFQVAGLLSLAAALWPALSLQTTFVTWAEVATLAAVAVIYGAAAFLLRQRAWAYVSVALLPVAYGLGMTLWGLGFSAALLGWALLAAALWAAAEVAARRTGEGGRELAETVFGWGAWRSRFASPLFAAAYAVSVLAAAMGLPQDAGVAGMPAETITGLLLVCALYAASAAGRRTSLFLYPATWLLLVPLGGLAAHAYAQAGIAFTTPEQARLLALLGLGYLAMAFLLDRARGHYAKPVYLAAYALGVLGVLLAVPDSAITAQTLGIGLAGLVWSAWLVHRGRHPSYAWAVGQVVGEAPAAVLEAAEMLFQYLAVWLFPIWLLVLQSLRQPAPAPADYGLALGLLAPVYAALSLLFERVHAAYRLPWLIGAYALSVIGPLVALPDPTLRVAALAVSIALYVAFALRSRLHAWLWLAAALGPVLLLEGVVRFGDPARAYGISLVALSLGYGVLGVVIQRGGFRDLWAPLRERPRPFALPFLAVGQVLCLAGLLLVPVTQEPGLVLVGYALGAVQYAGSAAISRQSICSVPLAITLAVVYVSGMLYSPLAAADYGPALLPGLAAFLAIGEVFHRTADAKATVEERRGTDTQIPWAMPFETILHLGAVAAFLLCLAGTDQMIAWWGIAALYGALTALRRQPEALYPAIGAAIAAYLGTGAALAPDATLAARMLSLTLPVWVLVWLAHGIGRRQPADAASAPAYLSWAGPVAADPWARPLLVWGAATLALSVALSAGDALVHCVMADLGTALAALALLATFSLLWRSRTLVWASIAVLALAYEEALLLAGVPWADQPACWAAAALSGGLSATALGRLTAAPAKLWAEPLLWASYATGALALCVAIANLSLGRSALQPLAATLTVIGAYLLIQGLIQRKHLPCYLAIGLFNGALACELVYRQVAEAQAFAAPLGLSLLLMAYLEWRRGSAGTKVALEIAAIAVLLGTTLIQGCGGLGVAERYSYDTVLLLESVAVLGLGAMLRWKRTFFAACGALVADVCILLADPVRAMNTWYLVAIIGFAMIGLVVFLEQRREQIPLWIDEVRLRLEKWD